MTTAFVTGINKTDFVWLNNEFLLYNEAVIPVNTHSLHYGGAVFEGLRSYNGQVFKLADHTRRLLNSAAMMGLEVNYSAEFINNIIHELIRKNNTPDAYIRPLIWRGGDNRLGVYAPDTPVNLFIMVVRSRNEFKNGLEINISPWRKPHPKSLPPQSKSSAHYAIATVAMNKAKAEGYDDSLFLDLDDNIAECTTSNIFFGINDELVTPIADNFLNGITRQFVIKIAKDLGFRIQETRLKLDDIGKYDSCFLTGTAAEIKGIRRIAIDIKATNDKTIGHKTMGNKIINDKKLEFNNEHIVKQLQQQFALLVGK